MSPLIVFNSNMSCQKEFENLSNSQAPLFQLGFFIFFHFSVGVQDRKTHGALVGLGTSLPPLPCPFHCPISHTISGEPDFPPTEVGAGREGQGLFLDLSPPPGSSHHSPPKNLFNPAPRV